MMKFGPALIATIACVLAMPSPSVAHAQGAPKHLRPLVTAEELEIAVKKKQFAFNDPDDFPVMFGPLVLGIGGEVDYRKGRAESSRLVLKQTFYVVPAGERADSLVIDANGTQHYQKGSQEVFRCELCSQVHLQSPFSEYHGERVRILIPANFLFLVCYDPRNAKDVFVSTRERGGKNVLVPKCNVVREDDTVFGQIALQLSAQSAEAFELNIPRNEERFADLSGDCLKLVRKRKMLPGEVNELFVRLKANK